MPWQQYVSDVAFEIDPDTGLPAYREIIIAVPRQSGKAISVQTPILTSCGWKALADIRVDDDVYHPDGFTTRVTHVFDVMTEHDCYRVSTTDGRSIVVDADHLWTVQDRLAEHSKGPRGRGNRVRSHEWITATTRELLDAGLMRQASRTVRTMGKAYESREFRFRLPNQCAIKSPDVELPISPYLLGVWLGDGSRCDGLISVGVADLGVTLDLLRNDGHEIRSVREVRSGNWVIAIVGFRKALRLNGLLKNKHVPEMYLTAGHDQRLALLQGLMDTDGSISSGNSGTPRAEFCNTNQQIAESVLYLARSLGWRATIKESAAKLYGREVSRRWRVCFTPVSDGVIPFRISRKAARIGAPRSRGNELHAVSIVSIEPVESVPVRCIKVDSPDGLFLAGKDLIPTHNTLLCLAVMVHRSVGFGPPHGPAQNTLYTAQTGSAARTKFEKDHLPTLLASPFSKLFRTRMANGHEAVIWRNGSWISLTSTTQSSGHGESLDLGFIDEAWAHQDERLEQAFKPAMMTRANAQLWIPSTAGKVDSHYLMGKMDNGRAMALADVRSGVAYFEWSAPPGADPSDPRTWRACMPALCPAVKECRCAADGSWHHTVQESTVAADQKSMKPAEFRRAYMNIPESDVPEDWTVISEEDWTSILDGDSRAKDPVVFAMEITQERTFGTIAIAGARRDGNTHVEIVQHRTGTGWIVDALAQLQHKWHPAAIVVDPSGPAGSLIEPLEAAGVQVTRPVMRDVAVATGQLIDAVRQRRLRHLGGVPLIAAVAGAQLQPLGDAWRWARRGPSVDISPLVAATLAVWGQATYGRQAYDVLDSVW